MSITQDTQKLLNSIGVQHRKNNSLQFSSLLEHSHFD